MAIGFDIVIPDKLITKLAEADKRLKIISQTSEETKNRVVRAFNQMTSGADEFLKKLQQINTEVGKLGNVKLQITTTNTTQSVDDINKLIQLTEKLTAAQKKRVEATVQAELEKKAKSDARENTKRQISEEQRLTAQIKAQNAELSAEYKRRNKENIAIADNEAKKRIAASRLATNEITAQIQRETRFRIQEANRIAKLTQTPNTITRKDVGSIIGVSRNATSINQMQTAIKNLEKAKLDLDTTDKKYDKTIKAINKEIENQKQRLEELGVQVDNYKSKSSNLLNISEQLTRRLALVFSVSQITGYVKKLASVRGEFELQQKSLAAIIQNKDQANIVFDKVTKLAVQSPFQLKELVSYTKQLAAYKIETGKLYDNVKMLADISAGVGVDMSRLVLAYGQVASANYLRGTELRQFSEAGINVLGGLADYFSKLQGRVVGVAEVFDMVSRRMVKFSDVEKVLSKMTEAGGEFYNMQAIQAQTLKGQISNLKDSIDIMLNEIGESQEGKLKNSVALVRVLVENWRALESVLVDVGIAIAFIGFGNFVKGLSLSGAALDMAATQGRGMIAMAARLKTGVQGLGSVLTKVFSSTGGILGIVVAGIALVAKSLWDWDSAVEAQNKVYDKNSVALSNEIDRLNKVGNEYRKYSAEIITAEAAMQKAKDENNQEEYNKALEESNTLQKEQLRILEQLKKEYPDIYNNLNSEKVSWQELTAEIEKANEAKLTQLALNQGKKGSFWGGDSEGENINDVQDKLSEYYKLLQDAQGKLALVNSNLKVSLYEGVIDETQLQKAKGLLDELNSSISNGDDILIIKRKEKAFREYTKSIGLEYDNLYGAIKDAYRKWYVDFRNVSGQFKNLEKNWENNIDTYKAKWIELGEIDTSTEAGKRAAKQYLDSMIGQLESEDKNIQNRFKKWLERVLHTDFNFEIEVDGGKGNEPQLEWVKRVKDNLADIQKQMPKNIKYLQGIFEGLDFTIKLPENQEDYEEYYKLVVQWVDKIRNAYNRALNDTDVLISKKETESLGNALKFAEQYLATLGGGKQKKETTSKDKIPEQIRVLKELHKSYIDLNDIFDETTSKKGAIEKFGNAFKEAFNVDIKTYWEGLKDKEGLQLDFTTEEGIVAAFDKLIRSIPDQKKRVQAELAKAEFIMEYRIQAKKDADQQLTDEVQKFFDNYDMKIELDKLGISGDFANALFGIESMDLDKLRENLTSKEDEFIGRNMEKEYKAFQDKLTEIEVKAQQERLKKYLQYTRDAISERAKLELQGAKNLAEIEKTWAQAKKDIEKKYAINYDTDSADEIARKTEEKTNALLALESSKPQAIEGVRKEMQGALQALDWEQFKSSDTFVSIFNDLSNVSKNALDSMISQLEKYKKEWTNLPIDQMKAVEEQLEKMREASAFKGAEANPFSVNMFKITKQEDIAKAQTDSLTAEQNILGYSQQIAELEKINQLLNENEWTSADIEEYNKKYNTSLAVNAKTTQDIVNAIKEEKNAVEGKVKKEKENQKTAQKTLQNAEKEKAALQAQSKALGEGLQMANDLYGSFKDVLAVCEEWGVEMDSSVAIFADMGMNMANSVIQTIQLQIQLQIAAQSATGLGAAMNTAMSVIGWVVMAVQLLIQALSAIAKAHDNKLQKQIERDAEAVELLQKRYEKLEEAIDNAMSFGEYQQAFDENKRTLEEQIRLTEDMIALEEDKKKTDEDAIKGYKDNIEEYNEQLQEMEEKRISDMGGFGSQEAIKDAVEGFIDAWAEAYNENGDGLDALKGKWDEYINNILKKQMMMKVAGKYIQPLLEEVDKLFDDDGILSSDDINAIQTKANESSESLNNIMKQLAEQMGWEGGTGGGSELDGLSESIQGVTEVTAQALEAILNSMRFYVIDNNKQLVEIANTLLSWESPTSPILAELKAQTGYLSSIDSLFNSIIDRSGSPAVRIR